MPSPTPVRLAALFDTSFGYGTPQLELFMNSLSRYFGANECWMIEPDIKGKPKLAAGNEILKFLRVATRFPPHFEVYSIEYNLWIEDFLSRNQIDVLVITNASLFPAVMKLKKRPKTIIYYMFENIGYQKSIFGWDVTILHQMAKDAIDLICVPELTRASFDLKWLKWDGLPVVEILNVSSDAFVEPSRDRNFSIVNAGSICENTLCQYLASAKFDALPIDVFGIPSSPAIRNQFGAAQSRGSRVRYKGSLSMAELTSIYGRYAYSLVMWAPTDLNQIHASPNKFFQSMAHGVPTIAAPHPQCVKYINKYGCGIIAEDWTETAILAAIEKAESIFGTSTYDQMVEHCRRAVSLECNWPEQFSKVIPHLIAVEKKKNVA